MIFDPAFVNVTYHQEEFEYQALPNGLLKKKTVRKRPGTVGIAAALMYRYHANVVPHIICGGFTREETENALIDLHFFRRKKPVGHSRGCPGLDEIFSGRAGRSQQCHRPG